MFDQLKELVQQQLANHPEVASLPAGQQEEVSHEVASHIQNGLASQAMSSGGIGGLLSQLGGSLGGGSTIVNSIEGGLVSSLGSKFGLSPMVTGAIAAALPGLLQKFTHKVNDPNDNSITPDSLNTSLSNLGGGGGLGGMLGGLFGK